MAGRIWRSTRNMKGRRVLGRFRLKQRAIERRKRVSTNPEGSGNKSSEFRVVAGLGVAIPVLVRFKDELGFDWIEPEMLWSIVVLGSVYVIKRGMVKVAMIKAGRFNGG